MTDERAEEITFAEQVRRATLTPTEIAERLALESTIEGMTQRATREIVRKARKAEGLPLLQVIRGGREP